MYRHIYVPCDNSDHSTAGIRLAVTLAARTGARVTGCHVYAARMHDVRFKQMEYTLPEEYQDEQELERQRKIHDSLITRGLQLISDSYLDVLKEEAAKHDGVDVGYKTFDGKNWECLAKDITDSDYDLVVMGALGMGAVRDSQLGSVADRVVRRVTTDVLLVRDTHLMRDGASDRIVVAVDGSPQSFAALRTAVELAAVFGKRIEAIAVYDPYLHYSMFNGIVDVLSAEASKVFRFKEQEQLHEEIIDTGLAKIYQSHLQVAEGVARDEGVEIETRLLDGKAFKKVLQHVREDPPWMLMLGRIGVHSDAAMDIGSTTENVVRMAPCNVFLSSGSYVPPVDMQADASVSWTDEARAELDRVPAHVQGVVRSAICRYALERGHSVISRSVIEQAVGDLMPAHAGKLGFDVAPAPRSMEDAASGDTYICRRCGRAARDVRPTACPVCRGTDFDLIDKESIARRAEEEGAAAEERSFDGFKVRWTLEGKQVLERVPKGYERRRVKARIEKLARTRRLPAITAEFADENLEDAYAPVADAVGEQDGPGIATANAQGWVAEPRPSRSPDLAWGEDAAARLDEIPAGFVRTLAKTKVEEFARRIHAERVTADVVDGGLADARDVLAQMSAAYGDGNGNGSGGDGGGGQCPYRNSAVPMAPGVEHPSPGWTEDGIRYLNEVAIKADGRFDPARAREMAQHAAESRAERRQEAINASFLERLGLKLGYGHPLSDKTYEGSFTWTPEARAKLEQVPEFCRELTRWRVEWTAIKKGLGDPITPEKMDVKYDMWGEVSHTLQEKGRALPWDDDADRRLARVPDFVKGQVVQAVEGNARELGFERVTTEVMDRVIEKWIATGDFHEGRFGFRA
jgi:nucleotide-binding universal stress UspA family protein